jgi:hypothetical protein
MAVRGIDHVGDSTIQGKYFNKIADELRLHRKGQIDETRIELHEGAHQVG